MKKCPEWETCTRYNSGDNKPPNQNVRVNHPCILFNGEFCDDSIVGAKIGGACNIEKRNKAFKKVKEEQ